MKIRSIFITSLFFFTASCALTDLEAASATPAPPAPCSITEHLQTCYVLHCLWTALYGPENPLGALVHTYEQAVTVLAHTQKAAATKRSRSLPTIIFNIQEQLAQIHAQATELINQYNLTTPLPPVDLATLTPPPPPSYTATPLPSTTPTSSDTATQQLLALLQQLPQQPYMHSQSPGTAIKEQLLLFGIGILVLAGITYGIQRTINKNTQLLKKQLKTINEACVKEHGNGKSSGMIGQLECQLKQLPKQQGHL